MKKIGNVTVRKIGKLKKGKFTGEIVYEVIDTNESPPSLQFLRSDQIVQDYFTHLPSHTG